MYHMGNYLLQGARYLKGVSDKRQKHITSVTPISIISANEKVHEQEYTPLNSNVFPTGAGFVAAPGIEC